MVVFKGNRVDYKYHTNKSVRENIDKIFHKCAMLFSNVNTRTHLDVGSRKKAKELEREYLREIEKYDKDFYRDRFKGL